MPEHYVLEQKKNHDEMKFIDLFEIAVKLGFKAIPVKDEYYKIAFKSSNSLNKIGRAHV